MIESLLANLDTLLLYVFAACALVGALLMIVLREPMRVALALISTMVFLGGIYGLLGVHFIAAFQVLIYVGAVMVFMVYVIMLLDPRDTATRRFSLWAIPGILAFVVFLAVLLASFMQSPASQDTGAAAPEGGYSLQRFSVSFLSEYWLQFELTSVLLVAAVVAALAVIRVSRRGRG
jgi:NADH-quinone oxidoreductase subunit J